MKYVFTPILMLCMWLGAMGETMQPADSINICGHKFEIPPEAKLTAPQQLTAPNYSITWEYQSEKQAERAAKRALSTLTNGTANTERSALPCYFLTAPTKAYSASVNQAAGYTGAIVIAATVNNQPVFVQILLSKPNFSNEKLPSFITRLITLSR